MDESWIEKAGADHCPEMLDEEACRTWALKILHPTGASCPACQKDVSEPRRLERFWKNERISCESCGKKFRAVSRSPLSGMHLDFRELFFLLHQNSSGIKAEEISRKMNVDGNTVRLWLGKLRG